MVFFIIIINGVGLSPLGTAATSGLNSMVTWLGQK
jgi:hypothetical protein